MAGKYLDFYSGFKYVNWTSAKESKKYGLSHNNKSDLERLRDRSKPGTKTFKHFALLAHNVDLPAGKKAKSYKPSMVGAYHDPKRLAAYKKQEKIMAKENVARGKQMVKERAAAVRAGGGAPSGGGGGGQ
jgi:hypothetical protein